MSVAGVLQPVDDGAVLRPSAEGLNSEGFCFEHERHVARAASVEFDMRVWPP